METICFAVFLKFSNNFAYFCNSDMNMFEHLYTILLGLFTEYHISNTPDFLHYHHGLEFVYILSHNDTC